MTLKHRPMKGPHRLLIIESIRYQFAVPHDIPVDWNVDHYIDGREIVRLIPGRHPQARLAGASAGPKTFAARFRPSRTDPMESCIRGVGAVRIPQDDYRFPPADESAGWHNPEPVLVTCANRLPSVDVAGTHVKVLSAVQADQIHL